MWDWISSNLCDFILFLDSLLFYLFFRILFFAQICVIGQRKSRERTLKGGGGRKLQSTWIFSLLKSAYLLSSRDTRTQRKHIRGNIYVFIYHFPKRFFTVSTPAQLLNLYVTPALLISAQSSKGKDMSDKGYLVESRLDLWATDPCNLVSFFLSLRRRRKLTGNEEQSTVEKFLLP